MPLPSWKELWTVLGLRKDDVRSDEIRVLITDYVRDNMDVDMLSSDHSDEVYSRLITEGNQLARRYGFIKTSNDYPEEPTAHEKIIRGCAMRTHNAHRALCEFDLPFVDNVLDCLFVQTKTGAQRRYGGVSLPSSIKKAKVPQRSVNNHSEFLYILQEHGSVCSAFSAKLLLTLRGEEKIDSQIEALRNKTFSQIGVFAKDVAESSKPAETPWQLFLANEIMWEHSRKLY
ncbi:LOW QUALITY PROTEIN: hypothetical protein CVT26_004430 [Gymnopilus dilepis]|uniref:Uncharacterized protein n=1 Tax=Gymnopilus dilepis TaxID=231916 RepID=A0A409WPI5_9AGAR|nr:LOW QUALITY PROTEIN: hypothetical protein CVT26_004430 [Gymnopilus dilepis]